MLAGAADLTLPALDGKKALKTVQTVLGQAIIYSGSVKDALSRTVEVLKTQGYTAMDSGTGGGTAATDTASTATASTSTDATAPTSTTAGDAASGSTAATDAATPAATSDTDSG